jgi:hypothetical protein
MDSDEFEQIPWSGLVDQAKPPVDPKWYLAGGVIGAIVIILLALRMFSGLSTPDVAPIIALDPPVELTMPDALVAPVIDPGGGAVTEADLMAIDEPIDGENDTNVLRLVSEWFVTDYYTVDDSSENERSLKNLLAQTASGLVMPHSGETSNPATYVEWARSVDVRDIGEEQVEVAVVYRTITETDAGFVRDPVSAVLVTVRSSQTDAGITGLPVPIDVPMPGTDSRVGN